MTLCSLSSNKVTYLLTNLESVGSDWQGVNHDEGPLAKRPLTTQQKTHVDSVGRRESSFIERERETQNGRSRLHFRSPMAIRTETTGASERVSASCTRERERLFGMRGMRREKATEQKIAALHDQTLQHELRQ